MTERYYWDACVFTSRLERTPGRIAILEHITDRAEKGEVEIVTSAFTLVEVAKVKDVDSLEDQEQIIVDFFENPYIIIQQVDRFVAELARDILRNATKIKPKDAIHIASAIQSRASVLHTYDNDHLIPKSKRFGNPPLTIEPPNWKDGQAPLSIEEKSDA